MKRNTLFLLLAMAMVLLMLAGCGGSDSGDGSSSSNSSSDSADDNTTYSLEFSADDYATKTATLNGKSVTYNFYQDIIYVANPVDADYESMNIAVPVEIDGVAVDASNAPILFEIGVGGYMSSSTANSNGISANGNGGRALAAGYVVVSPGCRGRDNQSSDGTYYGKAPAAIVDLKAAVRYMRYNAGTFPGNEDWIISSGGSAGGALSALLGASGNSDLYEAYFDEIGAADADDNIFAVGAWSPITNLEHADMAYEWEYGSAGASSNNQTISGELKALFETYQDGLMLTGHDDYAITAGNINDYILEYYLEPSAAAYLNSLSDPSSYLISHSWINWDGSAASFTFSDYVNYIGRGKTVPAFDSFFDSSSYSNVNTSNTAEVVLFGDSTTNARHFTDYSLQKTTGDSSAVIYGDLQTIVNMMNPMYFIGLKNIGCAEYWYIRDGAKALDTSAIIIVDLATSVENFRGADHVNAWEDWDQGHNVNADPAGFISWIGTITGYTN